MTRPLGRRVTLAAHNQDVLDTLPVRRGPEVWTAVEARKEALSDEFFIPASRGNPPPKLSLLSLANTLLRRLSRGQNTEFCGRVILLMTALLPLSDRSGLNLTGASNTANVTSWDEEEEAVAALEGGDAVGDEDGDEELPVEAAPRQDAQGEGLRSEGGADGGDKSGDGIAIDFAFYRAFWKLQHDMRDAHVAVSDRGAFDGFTDRCHTVLHALESVPVGPATAVGEGEFFAAKYLTSSRLLRLQLRDPQLRRHVLVQVLITLAYLRRAGTGNGEAGARARAALESIHKRTSALLRAVRPHGREFALAVRLLPSWWDRRGACCDGRQLSALPDTSLPRSGKSWPARRSGVRGRRTSARRLSCTRERGARRSGSGGWPWRRRLPSACAPRPSRCGRRASCTRPPT